MRAANFMELNFGGFVSTTKVVNGNMLNVSCERQYAECLLPLLLLGYAQSSFQIESHILSCSDIGVYFQTFLPG